MSAFRRFPHTRTRRRAAALSAVCCLAALPAASGAGTVAASAAVPAAPSVPFAGCGHMADGRPAVQGDAVRGQVPAGSAARSAAVSGGALLAAPGVQVRPAQDTPDLPSGLTSLSWLVSDARTGQVLAAKNAHRALPPASTLKTLFAVTVMPRFPRETTHTVTESDLAGIGEGSSMVGVQIGHTYTVADLWRGVFLSSGNDAVHVLAHMNGSVALTVAQMQAKARMLGAYDTHVVSPDGYDMPGQVSSAYDLALFARAGLALPDFAQYVSTATARFPGGCDTQGKACSASFDIQNTNRLLTGADGVTPYPGVIGVKNGYTTNAGHTLIAAARRGGRTLIATLMNPQSGGPQGVYREAAKLLDWGFRAAGRTTSVGTLNAAPAGFQASPAPAPPSPAAHRKEPAPARADGASPAAWYVGGALTLAAGLSVLVLRRRHPAKAD